MLSSDIEKIRFKIFLIDRDAQKPTARDRLPG